MRLNHRKGRAVCWADKLGTVWACVVVGIVLALQERGGFLKSIDTESGLAQWFRLFALVVLPVWVILRLMDWVAGGPAKRKGLVRAQILPYVR